MINYIRVSDNSVFTPPVLESMLGIRLPNPDVVAKAGFAPVDYVYPEYDTDTQRLEPEGGPVKADDGRYAQRFRVIDIPAEEMALMGNERRLEEETA